MFKLKTDKKFRYGTYSVLTSFVVIAILIFINLLVSQFNIKVDLSADKTYSLSDTSKGVLDALEDSVTIYPLFKTGSESIIFAEMLDLYSAYSNKIKVINKDPYIYPTFTSAYSKGEDIPINSIIVESGKRFRVILPSDLINYNFNTSTMGYDAESIDLEPRVTSAIQFVAMDEIPKIYNVTGHNEMAVPDTVITKLELANFSFENVDILSSGKIPDDCDVLFITTPSKDYTPDEARAVNDYLANDGRAVFFIDYYDVELPNLKSVINGYGVDFDNTVVIEGNSAYSFQNSPSYLLPRLEDHDINTDIIAKGYRVLVPIGQSITVMELKKSNVTVEPVLTSSKESYGKNNPDSQSINKEAGDVPGPLNIAVAITDAYFTDAAHMTKVVVVGSAFMMTGEVDSYVSYTNSDFVLSCIDWLHDETKAIYIQPKSLNINRLIITTRDIDTITLISHIAIPGVIFAVGLIVWLRRRNK